MTNEKIEKKVYKASDFMIAAFEAAKTAQKAREEYALCCTATLETGEAHAYARAQTQEAKQCYHDAMHQERLAKARMEGAIETAKLYRSVVDNGIDMIWIAVSALDAANVVPRCAWCSTDMALEEHEVRQCGGSIVTWICDTCGSGLYVETVSPMPELESEEEEVAEVHPRPEIQPTDGG